MTRRIVRVLTAAPWAWIVGIALVTGFFAARASHLTIREELLDYWPEDDPDLERLNDTLDRFGIDGGGVLGLRFPDAVVRPGNLADIARWAASLEGIPDVTSVVAITSVSTVQGDAAGIEVAPLVPEPYPASAAEQEAIERRALDDPDIGGRLLSRDRRSTAIFLSYPDVDNAAELEIGQAIWRLAHRIERERPDVEVFPTGQPAFLEVFRELTVREVKTLYPAVVLAMVALLWFSFRDVRATLIPFAVIAVSCIWTVGLLDLAGRFLNSSTVVIPAVVILISVADTVHIVNQYFETVRRAVAAGEQATRRELMQRTLERVLSPCFLTTLTTVVGFLSLLLVDVPIVQEIGIFVTFGISVAFLVTVTLVPACYVLSPLPAARATEVQTSGWIGALLARVIETVLRRPRAIGVGALLLTLFGLVGLTRVTIDFQWKEAVKEGHRIREAIRFLDDELGGYDWLTVVLRVPDGTEGDLLDPRRLAAVGEVRDELARQPFVGHVDSLAGPLELASSVFHDGREDMRVLPETRGLAAQFLLLFELGDPDSLDAVLTPDRRVTQVSARLTSPGSRRVRQWLGELEPFVARVAAESGLDAYVSGFSQIFSKLNQTIALGLVSSLSGALLVIAVIMTIELGSVRLGIASMIPNVIPVLATLGFMGYAGIYLSGQTAMIGCIGIGLAVDDTIHFLHRFHRELDRHDGDRRAAIVATMESTGRAIVFTSLVLMAGFSLLVLSSLVQFTEFGLLTAICMATAILGDLLLLPVLLLAFPWLTAPEAARAAARTAP